MLILWIALAVIFLLLDFFKSYRPCLWLFIGSIGSLIVNLLGLDFVVMILKEDFVVNHLSSNFELTKIISQALVFVIGIILAMIMPKIIRKARKEYRPITNVDRIRGLNVQLTKQAEYKNPGEALIGDVEWSVVPKHKGVVLEEGTICKVVRVKGIRLVVIVAGAKDRKRRRKIRRAQRLEQKRIDKELREKRIQEAKDQKARDKAAKLAQKKAKKDAKIAKKQAKKDAKLAKKQAKKNKKVEEPVVEEQPVVEEVVEEPVVEEQPVVEEPVVEEQPVIEEVAEEPVIEEQPVIEEVAEEPVIEEQPVVEEVVEEVTEEPVIEEQPVIEEVAEEPIVEELPVVEEDVEEVAEEPVIEEQPVVEEVVEEVTEEPVIEEQPVIEEVAEEPIVEELPVVEEDVEEVAEEPVVEEQPVVEEVVEEVTEEPVVEEQPVIEEVAEEPVVEETASDDNNEDDANQNDIPDKEIIFKDGKQMLVIYRKSIGAKVALAHDNAKQYYVDLANYVAKYKGVRRQDSWEFTSYYKWKNIILKLAIKGRTLYLYTSLPFEEYKEQIYYLKESKSKVHQNTPTVLHVKSDRSFNYAKQLIDIVMASNGATYMENCEEVESLDKYQNKTREQLLEEGLIKCVYAEVK